MVNVVGRAASRVTSGTRIDIDDLDSIVVRAYHLHATAAVVLMLVLVLKPAYLGVKVLRMRR